MIDIYSSYVQADIGAPLGSLTDASGRNFVTAEGGAVVSGMHPRRRTKTSTPEPCLYFPSNASRITVGGGSGAFNLGVDFTIEAMIWPYTPGIFGASTGTLTTDFSVIWAFGTAHQATLGYGLALLLNHTTGVIYLDSVTSTGSTLITFGSVVPNKYNHIELCVNGNAALMFRDGVNVNSYSVSSFVGGWHAAAHTTMCLGNYAVDPDDIIKSQCRAEINNVRFTQIARHADPTLMFNPFLPELYYPPANQFWTALAGCTTDGSYI